MKKVLVIVMAAVLAMSMSFAAFAANGCFLESPSLNNPIALVSANAADGAALQSVIITPFANRATLDAESKAEIEAAYNVIAGTNDASTLAEGLEGDDLAVSDLFDVQVIGATGAVTIVLKSDVAKGFVALLHYNGQSFDVVEGAKADGENITFTIDDFSPYAIVVDTSTVAPQTGENNTATLVFAGIAAVAACGIVVLLAMKKKVNA